MGMLFKSPKVKVPKPDAPIPTPTMDDAVKQRTETDRLRKRKGIKGNIMAGQLGVTPTVGQKTLTGS